RHTRYWRDWSSDVCSSDLDKDSERKSAICVTPRRLAVMKIHECRRKFSTLSLLLISIVAVAVLIGACTTPEKAKAQHVARGQALLKDKKFQEAALEFRSALQIDEKLADAHWGLAQ